MFVSIKEYKKKEKKHFIDIFFIIILLLLHTIHTLQLPRRVNTNHRSFCKHNQKFTIHTHTVQYMKVIIKKITWTKKNSNTINKRQIKLENKIVSQMC